MLTYADDVCCGFNALDMLLKRLSYAYKHIHTHMHTYLSSARQLLVKFGGIAPDANDGDILTITIQESLTLPPLDVLLGFGWFRFSSSATLSQRQAPSHT
jgi:hypothetical protein